MVKILANSSLRNRTLRQRKDLSPLLKTHCHRYHYQSVKTYKKWQSMLSGSEIKQIADYYGGQSETLTS